MRLLFLAKPPLQTASQCPGSRRLRVRPSRGAYAIFLVFHFARVLESLGRQGREQARKIVMLFAIGTIGEFEHSPAPPSQLLDISAIRH